MGSHVTRDIEIRNPFIDALNIFFFNFEISIVYTKKKRNFTTEQNANKFCKEIVNIDYSDYFAASHRLNSWDKFMGQYHD